MRVTTLSAILITLLVASSVKSVSQNCAPVQAAPAAHGAPAQAAPAHGAPAQAAKPDEDNDPVAAEAAADLPSPKNEPERDTLEYELNGQGKVIVVDWAMEGGKKMPSQVRDCHIKNDHVQKETCRAEPALLQLARQHVAKTGELGDLTGAHVENKKAQALAQTSKPVRMLAKKLN